MSITQEKISEQFHEIEQKIQEGLKATPTRYLVFWIFCGRFIKAQVKDREVKDDSHQSFILNQFDEKTEFYKLFPVEQKIKDIADRFRNSYHLGIFIGQSEPVKKYQGVSIAIEMENEESKT